MSSPAAEAAQPLQSFPWKAWWPAACCLTTLLAATHVPLADGPSLNNSDKIVHLSAYLLLVVTILLGLERTLGRLEARHYFSVWLFGSFLGLCDELTQSLSLFHRTTDIVDWMADVAGVLAGIVVYQVWRPWLHAVLDPINAGR